MASSLAGARPRGWMLGTVFSRTLRDQRRALTWWAIGFVGTVLMYAAFWPNIRENAGRLREYIQSFPTAIRELIGADFGTPEGYLQAELFSFMGPILLFVYAIGAGSRGIAGEEEAGTLDLLLSAPVTRRRVVLDKFWALVVGTFGLSALLWAAVVFLGPPFDLRLDVVNLSAVVVNLFLLGVGFGAIALAVGAASGSKGLAIGAASGIALVTFILNTLAPSVDALRPLRRLSPFYYYLGADPLTRGFAPGHVFLLALIPLAALLVALVTFEGRDIRSR